MYECWIADAGTEVVLDNDSHQLTAAIHIAACCLDAVRAAEVSGRGAAAFAALFFDFQDTHHFSRLVTKFALEYLPADVRVDVWCQQCYGCDVARMLRVLLSGDPSAFVMQFCGWSRVGDAVVTVHGVTQRKLRYVFDVLDAYYFETGDTPERLTLEDIKTNQCFHNLPYTCLRRCSLARYRR